MLSRVATSLYLVGRRLERADHTARLASVHQELALEGSQSAPRLWRQLADCLGLTVPDGAASDLAAVTRVAAGDAVTDLLRNAADAARAVRPSLSSETFEQINTLRDAWQAEDEQTSHRALRRVQMGVALVTGLVDDAMATGPERSFLQVGRYLERVGNVTTLVAIKCAGLVGHESVTFWPAVLRSAWSLDAYRMRGHPVPVEGPAVVQALLFDAGLPRSAACAAGKVVALSLELGSRTDEPHRAAQRLARLYQPAVIAFDDLPELRERSGRAGAAVETALRQTYFLPSRILGHLDVADQQQ